MLPAGERRTHIVPGSSREGAVVVVVAVVFALSLRYRRAVQTRTRLITEKGNTTTIPTAVISIIVVVLIIITTTDYPGESIITVLIAKSITNDSYLADRLMHACFLPGTCHE